MLGLILLETLPGLHWQSKYKRNKPRDSCKIKIRKTRICFAGLQMNLVESSGGCFSSISFTKIFLLLSLSSIQDFMVAFNFELVYQKVGLSSSKAYSYCD